MNLDREIIGTQLRTLFKDLVDQGFFNVENPVSNISSNWAQFYWGSPERYSGNWSKPIIFMNNIQSAVSFHDNCYERLTFTATIGVQAKCNQVRIENAFEKLWDKIKRAWSAHGMLTKIPSLSITDSLNNTVDYANVSLGQLGFSNAEVVSSVPFDIDSQGKFKRYQGLLQFELLFSSVTPVLQ